MILDSWNGHDAMDVCANSDVRIFLNDAMMCGRREEELKRNVSFIAPPLERWRRVSGSNPVSA